jgi:hypothetical protein
MIPKVVLDCGAPAMSLRNLMLEDLERGLAIFRAGHEIVPSWRILSPEGDFVIVTRFDPDKPDQREQMLALVPRLMRGSWRRPSC